MEILGRTRARAFDVLQAAAAPLAVAELAERLGLHPNTARFHLDALVDAGLAERAVEPARRTGRPRILYTATPDSATVGERNYRLLAEILTGHLAAHSRSPVMTATKAGREWGRCLAERPAPFERPDAAQAAERLAHVLGGIGFRPEVVGSEPPQLRLHHCPFREVAADNARVVCSVHRGLIEGVLAGMDAPLAVERVEPYVEPTWCAVVLSDLQCN